MARPSNAETIAKLRARVEELEAQLEGQTGGPVSFFVKGQLKKILRHPENSVFYAREALSKL